MLLALYWLEGLVESLIANLIGSLIESLAETPIGMRMIEIYWLANWNLFEIISRLQTSIFGMRFHFLELGHLEYRPFKRQREYLFAKQTVRETST